MGRRNDQHFDIQMRVLQNDNRWKIVEANRPHLSKVMANIKAEY